MEQSKENLVMKLKKKYLDLVKRGLQIQRKGDIKAYALNAIQAENVAEKLQALARRK